VSLGGASPPLPSGSDALMSGSHVGQPGHVGDLEWDRDHSGPVDSSAGFSDARAPTWECELGCRQENWCFFMN